MCWEGLLDAEQGRMTEAFENIYQAYVFGQHIYGQKTTLIEQLVAMAVGNMANKTLRIIKKDTPRLTTAKIEKVFGGKKGSTKDSKNKTATTAFKK